MPRTTAATKRAIWWTVSSRMRDGDAGDDDGAAILEGIRPSRLPFSLSILELRRQAIAWRSRRRPSKVPFLFPGPSIDSEVWNARRRYVFSFASLRHVTA